MRNRLDNQSVVITGASSGIGRATALMFAEMGASVTLVARRDEPLHELAAECERAGGRALVVTANVTEEDAVHEVARRAVEAFGKLDVWVNNAAVTAFGFFEDTPTDTFRQIIETNLFGYVHGARAALPYFRKQGRGVLINVGSVVSQVAEPYATAYSASKWAVRGFSQSLRQELFVQGQKDIHVCTVMPATIDTPIFQHAGNYSGREVVAMPPIYPADQVARTIVKMVVRPEREIFVGGMARMFWLMSMFFPATAERQMAMTAHRKQLSKDEAALPTNGNLFAPMRDGMKVSGGWKQARRAQLLRNTLVFAAAAAPLVAGAMLLGPKFGPAIVRRLAA
jgi:short-subunit dehydrogenase